MAKEYIERDKVLALETFMQDADGFDCSVVLSADIRQCCAADVAPVVHGWWSTRKITDDHTGSVSYSHFHDDPKCKYYYVDSGYGGHYYCPNCGAKMDGK